MSLINDALKRAQAHEPVPPPALHFRPAEPGPSARQAAGVMVPVGLAMIALLVLFMVWQQVQRGRDEARVAQKPAIAKVHLAASPAAPPLTPQAAPPAPLAADVEPPVSAPDHQALSPAPPASPASSPEPPKPPELRLQAILFNPARPSAIVNGKTVFVGTPVAEWRVSAITQDSATLVSGGKTNVLTLE